MLEPVEDADEEFCEPVAEVADATAALEWLKSVDAIDAMRIVFHSDLIWE